jgi:Protein of unknown function (DUF2752)
MAVLSRSVRPVRSATATPTGILAGAALAALCAAALMAPADAVNGPVVCPFRLATGLPCPGCGMTRAWVFVAHGRIRDALSANPFVLVTLPAAITLVLLVGAALVRRRPLPDLTGVTRSLGLKVVVAVWLGFAIVRLVAVLTGHASA